MVDNNYLINYYSQHWLSFSLREWLDGAHSKNSYNLALISWQVDNEHSLTPVAKMKLQQLDDDDNVALVAGKIHDVEHEWVEIIVDEVVVEVVADKNDVVAVDTGVVAVGLGRHS